MEEEKAEFICSVSKDTYEVKWFRGDKEIKAGDKYDIVSEGKRRALIVKKCEAKDEGSYVAHIGDVKASADLYVIGESRLSFTLTLLRYCILPQSLNTFLPYFRETKNHHAH